MVNLVKKKSFHGEIWMQCCGKKNLVKTWWNFKPGDNLVKYINLVKTWWKLGEFQKLGENLVKNINLVKTWWKLGEFQKLGEKLGLGENLVNFLNLVKSWWISQTWWKFSETSNNSINFVKKCRKQNKNGEHLVKT